MIYSVRARWLGVDISDFYRQLIDGTIAHLKPDGMEILAAMRRARVTAPGVVEWTERCRDGSPLDHQRKNLYVKHFSDIEATPTSEYWIPAGKPFMNFLAEQA